MPNITDLVNKIIYYVNSANVGYDQSQRYNLYPNGETDCSWLILGSMKQTGFKIGNATTTFNMESELTKYGWVKLPNDGAPQYGDIVLNTKHHTALCIGNNKLAQASIDENGHATGGKTGDQTNNETNIRNYYNYPWDCYLRFMGNTLDNGDNIMANALYDTKGSDGRNLFDSIIQTRNELRDRAAEGASTALIKTRGNDGRNVLDGVIQTRTDISNLTAQVAALSTAVETLAKIQGADPATITKTISDAVDKKLATLKITTE